LPRARDRAPFADAFAWAAGRLPPFGAAGFVAAFDVAAGVAFVVALAGVAFATAVPLGFAVPTFAVAAFTGTFGEVAAFVTVALGAALAGADLPPAGLLVPAGFFAVLLSSFAVAGFAAGRARVVLLVATGLHPPFAGQCGRRVDCLFELLSFEMQHLELSFEIVNVGCLPLAGSDADERLEVGQALLDLLLAKAQKTHAQRLPVRSRV